MADPRSNNPVLPSMSELTSRFMRCPSCPQYFTSLAELEIHQREEQHFTLHTNLTHRPANQSARRLQHDFSYDMPSPVSSSGSESDAMFTPSVSRATSPNWNIGRDPSRPYRRSSKATNRRDSRQDPVLVRQANNPSKMEKKDKEKFSRSEQGAVPIRMESFLENYCRWRIEEQSSGNGTGSGCYGKKITLLGKSERLMTLAFHRWYEGARRQGPEAIAQLLEEVHNVLNASDDERPPFYGSLLYDENEQLCNHVDSKSKQCSVHGHPDWRECRRMRHKAIFARNLARLDRELGVAELYKAHRM